MKRHALGLVGFFVSALVSFALVLLVSPTWHRSAPASGSDRIYATDNPIWTAFQHDTRTTGYVYRCSDGAELYYVTHDYGSPEAARTAFGSLRAQAGPSVIAREARAVKHTFLVFKDNQVGGAYTTYGSVWVDGSRLEGIYGPTPEHVLELDAANPSGSW